MTRSPSSQPRASLARTILKNTLFVTLGNIALKVLNFLFQILIIRRLGDDRFGQYATVLAFVGLCQIFAELGITQYVMREVARDQSKRTLFFWDLIMLRMILAIFGIIFVPLAGIWYGYAGDLVLGIFIYTTTFLLASFDAPLSAILTANERMEFISGITVVGQISFMVVGGFFLFSGLNFTWLILASLISFVPRIALGIWATRRHQLLPSALKINPRIWPKLIRGGLPFGVITLTLAIATGIDTVMLSRNVSSNEVGWYNVAYNLIFSIMFLTTGFKDAIVPSLARAYEKDPSVVQQWYYRSVKYIVIFSLPIAVGGMITAHGLIKLLYSDQYLPAGAALQILVWDVPPLMFAGFCGRITTVIGKERAAARIYIINALANIALNLVVIPRYGMIGAACVTVFTDIISAFQFHLLLSRSLKLPNLGNLILKAAGGAVGMGIVLYLANGLGVLLLIGLGILIYGLEIVGLHLLDEQELEFIRKLWKKVIRQPSHA